MTYLGTLKKLAQAATPGPWIHHSTGSVRICDGQHDSIPGCATIAEAEVIGRERNTSVATAAYIAALSPEVVLALVECVRAADAMRYIGCDSMLKSQIPHPPNATDAYDAARARLEET